MTDDVEQQDDLPDRLDYETWRTYLIDEVLLGQQCQDCGFVSTTPRRVCVECHAEEPETVELPTTGVVHSDTSIEVTPEGFDDSGYRVGIVHLGDARVTARLDDGAAIGDEVSLSGVLTEMAEPVPVFE